MRAVQGATVLPVCALTLATGGDDLPVLALCLLALALFTARRPGWAGVAVGVAGALKLFAWPVALVLLIAAAAGSPRAKRSISRFFGEDFRRVAAGAVGIPLAALLPAVLADPSAAVENLVRFPLGAGLLDSPAQSPLPGHLIASGAPGGRAITAALLAAAGAAIAVQILRRPPKTAAAVALVSAFGLLTAILLLPSTRFGYLLYPAAFALAAPALAGPKHKPGSAVQPAETAEVPYT